MNALKISTYFMIKLIFLIYLGILIWICLFKMSLHPLGYLTVDIRSLNLFPFAQSNSIKEPLLNILVFVPFGFFLSSVAIKSKFLRKLFLVILLSASFEILQYLLSIGQSDITDLITNTSGGLIGLFLYQVLKKRLTDKILNKLILFSGILIIIAVAYYFKIRLDFMQRMRQMYR